MPKTTTTKQTTKSEKVVELLKRRQGASLEELTKATGWLPHSARAAMTGLRKKGHAVERATIDGVSRYSIAKGT